MYALVKILGYQQHETILEGTLQAIAEHLLQEKDTLKYGQSYIIRPVLRDEDYASEYDKENPPVKGE